MTQTIIFKFAKEEVVKILQEHLQNEMFLPMGVVRGKVLLSFASQDSLLDVIFDLCPECQGDGCEKCL